MSDTPKVLILGGGLAGLTAAHRLQQQGISFYLLEGRDRLGGRIDTVTLAPSSTLELGATWFADKHTSLMQLIAELQVPFQKHYTGEQVLYDFANPARTLQEVTIPSDQEPSFIFTGGSQTLIHALAQQVPTDCLRLGERVTSITWGKDGFEIKATSCTYRADYVINTLPPNLQIASIRFEPVLPERLTQLCVTTHTWMGSSIKVGVMAGRPSWREKKIGMFFSQFGPIQELHDHIHYAEGSAVLKGFVDEEMRRVSTSELLQMILQQLNLYGVNDVKTQDIILKDWRHDDYTYYEYPSYVGPHQNNGHPLLRQTCYEGRYFLAGSETASQYPGYMDGAVERANEVVQQISSQRSAAIL